MRASTKETMPVIQHPAETPGATGTRTADPTSPELVSLTGTGEIIWESSIINELKSKQHPMITNKLSQTFEFLLGATVGIGCLMTLLKSAHRIAIPYQINYAEGPILNAAVLVAHGANPYPAMTTFPYILNGYGTVGYHVVAFVVKLGGVNFAGPRLVILCAALLLCSVISALLHQWTQSWRLALTFGFIFLTIPLVHPWLYVLRLDFVALLPTLTGLYLFVRFPRHWYFAIPLFVVAMFGLYTLVAAPGACFLFLLAKREWKKASLFAAGMTTLIILVFLWEQHQTHGWFAFYMFGTHSSPYFIRQAAEYLRPVLRTHGLLFILALTACYGDFFRRSLSLPVIYLGLCCFTSLTAGKQGALDNHLLQMLVAVCLCGGIGYHQLANEYGGQLPFALVSAALALVVLVHTPFQYREPIEDLAECDKAYSYLRSNSGEKILSENVGVLTLQGSQIFISDPFLYRWMVTGSARSDQDLEQRIKARYFDLIVLNNHVDEQLQDNWPSSLRHTIEQHYDMTKQFVCRDTRYFYEPKSSGVSLRQTAESRP
jgi:hypothetical protein